MRLSDYPIKGDDKWELLSKVIDSLKQGKRRKFLRIEEIKLKSVYSFMSKFEVKQFINSVFSILNVNTKRRRNKPSLLILDWIDISLDLNSFRSRDSKNNPINGIFNKGVLSRHENDDSG